jgi:uncharacterized protein GlcG (DUF336 family)
MGMTNRAIAARAADSPEFFTSVAALAGGRILSVPGGVFVRSADGVLLGAVGVTGDASLNDEAAAWPGSRPSVWSGRPAPRIDRGRAPQLRG